MNDARFQGFFQSDPGHSFQVYDVDPRDDLVISDDHGNLHLFTPQERQEFVEKSKDAGQAHRGWWAAPRRVGVGISIPFKDKFKAQVEALTLITDASGNIVKGERGLPLGACVAGEKLAFSTGGEFPEHIGRLCVDGMSQMVGILLFNSKSITRYEW